jgi:hypothetical protein
VLAAERAAGLDQLAAYHAFAKRVEGVRRGLLGFLHAAKAAGLRVAAYGAPAKGNTLLVACGIGRDLLDFTVDRSPHKQGRLLPGSHLPVFPPQRIFEVKPDYLLILPWNLREEIIDQMAGIRAWGGRFVVPVPSLEVVA